MSLKKCGVVLVLLAMMVGAVTASAGAASPSKKIDNKYIIVSGYDEKSIESIDNAGMVTALGVYTIAQGQTNGHSKYIGPGCYDYYVDLNWGNSANSLRLTIIDPSNVVIGTFYDSSDGRIDGRIYLHIISNTGKPLDVGIYGHFVYGYKVTGVEDYTI